VPPSSAVVASLQDALVDPQQRRRRSRSFAASSTAFSVSASENGFTVELVAEITNLVRLSAGAESLGNEPYRSSERWLRG
jgi:hypothetical protein